MTAVEGPRTAAFRVANVIVPADPDELSPLDLLIHERRVKRAQLDRKYAAREEANAQLAHRLNEILGGGQ